MTVSPRPRVGPLEELRRRRVWRVSVGYVAASFAVLESVVALVPHLTDLAFRILLGTAVLGFPVAVVLSFEYDLTGSGIVRTPEDATEDPEYGAGPARRWLVFVLVMVAVGLAARWLRSR